MAQTQAQSAPNAYGAGNVAAAANVRVVACPCCGANNTVTGALGECEYCGSPLQ